MRQPKNPTFGNLDFGPACKNSQAFLKEFYEYPASLEEFSFGEILDPASVCITMVFQFGNNV